MGVREVTHLRRIRSVRVGSACSGTGFVSGHISQMTGGEPIKGKHCIIEMADGPRAGQVHAVNVVLLGSPGD